jgi:hypothetical protein
MYSGFSLPIASILLIKFWVPSAVLGGKNSNEKVLSFAVPNVDGFNRVLAAIDDLLCGLVELDDVVAAVDGVGPFPLEVVSNVCVEFGGRATIDRAGGATFT